MKKTNEKDEFSLANLPSECSDPSISKDDFKLVQVDAKIHDQKFETKPTTFFKDCIKRFRKNKSSVVAAFILGILIVLSILVPIVFKTSSVHDTTVSHPELYYLEPRLFDAGTGFWDGTKKMENIIVDTKGKDKDKWGPDEESFNPNAVHDLKTGEEQIVDTANEYAHGGYLQLGYYSDIPSSIDYVAYSTQLSVAQMVSSEEKIPTPDDPTARANIKGISYVYCPTSLQQKSAIDLLDFAAEIEYDDPDNEYDGKDGSPWSIAKVPVDSVELDTNSIGTVTGTVKVGLYSKTFTIDIVEKEVSYLNFVNKLEITKFVTLDSNKLLERTDEKVRTYPEGYVDAKSALYLRFVNNMVTYDVQLTEYKFTHDIGVSEEKINVTEKFKDFCDNDPTLNVKPLDHRYEVTDIQIEMRVLNSKNAKNSCTLVESFDLESSSPNYNEKSKFKSYHFDDGNDILSREAEAGGVWIISGTQSAKYTKIGSHLIKAVLCSFVYDTYEAVLGKVKMQIFTVDLDALSDCLEYNITFIEESPGKWVIDKDLFFCKITDSGKCPLVKEFKYEDIVINDDASIRYIKCEVYRYKMEPYNLNHMPHFLMGADKTGRDMFIYVFEGLRTSLLLGIATSAVCFLFGLLWGSICGYFGGNVDLIMERFTDILSGVPWIVVMTLTIIHLGSSFFTFALALCLTGWIGTAATTRTQFYRFRGREYVLASRTLGASHARLITKHILPNAMGTIITSAVLMVPSVIFSEATISYLGLGFKNLASLGVILSDNQVELTNHPYLLIFPAIIIALLMISFNLFGNGLRDAVNPSLKGEGE